MSRKIAVLVLVCTLTSIRTRAEVADSTANGFTIKITASIHAAPADVYKKLVHNVGDWWSSQHTFSGDAHNLFIEERPMGCFCEKLANGAGVRHMEVLFFAPGKMLRLSGALGPLQGLAATGTLTFTLAPDNDGTKLDVAYAVGGYLPNGMNSFAAPVDGVLGEQILRLKSYIETGNPGTAPKPEKRPA